MLQHHHFPTAKTPGIAIRQLRQLFAAFDGGASIRIDDYQPTLPPGTKPTPTRPDCLMF
jgi:hypothetical protein